MYNKINFISGQRLMASDLNHMQDGIAVIHSAIEVGANSNISHNGYDTIDKNGNPATTLGAIASGKGSVAFGGQRFDKIGNCTTLEEALAKQEAEGLDKTPSVEPITEARGEQSFAAGGGNIIDGPWSAGFGKDNTTYQRAAFVCGGGCRAGCTEEEYTKYNAFIKAANDTTNYANSYSLSHAGGDQSIAIGRASYVEGRQVVAYGLCSHGEGDNTRAVGQYSHAEGWMSVTGEFDENLNIISAGEAAHAEGYHTIAVGRAAHSEGIYTLASGASAHAEGLHANALGEASHAEGSYSNTLGRYAHTEGLRTTAGDDSDAATEETAEAAHAEGVDTKATARAAHAEGNNTTASGKFAHSEGYKTEASGESSHTEGSNCIASATNSHAGGSSSVASKAGSFVHGQGLTVGVNYGASFGKYNEGGNNLFEVGAGVSDEQKKTVFYVASNGNVGVYNWANKKVYSLYHLFATLDAFAKAESKYPTAAVVKEYDF